MGVVCCVCGLLCLQAKRPQLRTWLDEFGEVYSKAVIGGALGLMGLLLLTGVPLLGAAGQVCALVDVVPLFVCWRGWRGSHRVLLLPGSSGSQALGSWGCLGHNKAAQNTVPYNAPCCCPVCGRVIV